MPASKGKARSRRHWVVGDAQDQFFFGGADGAEAIQVIVDEEEELFGVLVEQDVFVGAQAVEEAIAAGCGFAFGCFWASLFLCVPAVGVDLGLAGGAGVIRVFHIHISGRVSPYLAFMLWGANRDSGGNFGKSLKIGGRKFSWGCHRKPTHLQKAGEGKRSYSFSDGSVMGLRTARMANPGSILFLAKTPSPAKPTKKAHTFGRSLRVSSVQACRREARPLRF